MIIQLIKKTITIICFKLFPKLYQIDGFDGEYYKNKYKDVAQSGMDPLYHYWIYGKPEGRSISIHKDNNDESNKSKEKTSSQNARAKDLMIAQRFNEEAIQLSRLEDVPKNWPVVDICCVTYNSNKWLDIFFSSLEKQDYPTNKLNIIFVDNGSNDGTVEYLEKYFQANCGLYYGYKVIQQDNLGFGAGNDRAIMSGEAEYCLVTNVDLEFYKYSITNVVRNALADKHGVVASWELRQTPYEHPKHYDPVTLETNWSSHACILIRKSAYIEVGGYDKNLFMYAEDVELSYRFRSYGYILQYVPKAPVIHHTYKNAGEIKPVQYIGSMVGHMYVRFKYGTNEDKMVGIRLLFRALKNPPIKNTRRKLIQNTIRIISRLSKAPKKGNADAAFPFREYDYEQTRFGAWYPVDINSEDKPLISVIIRTYKDRGFLLKQSIQTVFNQTYPRIELIVTEDGGTTQEHLVAGLTDQAPDNVSVIYVPNPKIGRSAVANNAMKIANGEYIVMLDDDDLYYSDHLEILQEALNKDKSAVAAYSPGAEIRSDVNYKDGTYKEGYISTSAALKQEWDYPTLFGHNYMIIPVLFKKSLFIERGGFDETLEYLEDWNIWLRYGYNHKFSYVAKTTSLYRTPMNTAVDNKRSSLMESYEKYCVARTIMQLTRIDIGLPPLDTRKEK